MNGNVHVVDKLRPCNHSSLCDIGLDHLRYVIQIFFIQFNENLNEGLGLYRNLEVRIQLQKLED